MNYSTEIQEKANRMIALGTKMTFESLCAKFQKQEDKSNSDSYKRNQDKKWSQREAVENCVLDSKISASDWLAEKNRENAMNNLPSSLR